MACNGSPMVIGLGTDNVYVASETAAFNRHTKNFIAMQDGEIAVITPKECSLDKARMELVGSVEASPRVASRCVFSWCRWCFVAPFGLQVYVRWAGGDDLCKTPPSCHLVGPGESERQRQIPLAYWVFGLAGGDACYQNCCTSKESAHSPVG